MQQALDQADGAASSASTERVPSMVEARPQHKWVKLRRILINGVELGCGETVYVRRAQFEVALQMQVLNMEQNELGKGSEAKPGSSTKPTKEGQGREEAVSANKGDLMLMKMTSRGHGARGLPGQVWPEHY